MGRRGAKAPRPIEKPTIGTFNFGIGSPAYAITYLVSNNLRIRYQKPGDDISRDVRVQHRPLDSLQLDFRAFLFLDVLLHSTAYASPASPLAMHERRSIG